METLKGVFTPRKGKNIFFRFYKTGKQKKKKLKDKKNLAKGSTLKTEIKWPACIKARNLYNSKLEFTAFHAEQRLYTFVPHFAPFPG